MVIKNYYMAMYMNSNTNKSMYAKASSLQKKLLVIYRICLGLTVGVIFIKRVLKNVSKRAFGELNNIFQDEFDKIVSEQSTNVRFFLPHN